jgi:lysophospholipid acyltransferase (LPLAT)-like uncharacterized protein
MTQESSATSSRVEKVERKSGWTDRRLDWAVRAGVLLMRMLASTWRIRVVGYEGTKRAREAGEPLIFSLWHGELFPLLWQHRNEGARVLISEHRDGEIVARAALALGFGTVRGSTSRGGGRALLEMVRVLREGGEVAVTPDGPRGPARRYAPGVLVAAQRSRVPIVCVGLHVSRGWRLNSWDRFLIPRPFARITVAYSEPVHVEAESAREAAEQVPKFEALHEAVSARAASGA